MSTKRLITTDEQVYYYRKIFCLTRIHDTRDSSRAEHRGPMQRDRSRSPLCDGRKPLQQSAQDSALLDGAAHDRGRPATNRPPHKVRADASEPHPSLPPSAPPRRALCGAHRDARGVRVRASAHAACVRAADATLTVVLASAKERPPAAAGEPDRDSAALARHYSNQSWGLEASEDHNMQRPIRHVSDGDARGASPVRDPGAEPQRGRMRRAECKAAGPRARALRLQVFKRTDLEVSHKLGSGSFGSVWQARVLPTSGRGVAQAVVVKAVWPDADLDRCVVQGLGGCRARGSVMCAKR